MKPHPHVCFPSLALPPSESSGPDHTGETQQPKVWNWHLDPELWARSVRQQLNASLRFFREETPSFDTHEAKYLECGCNSSGHDRNCPKNQKELLRAMVESEQQIALEFLLAELQSLLSAVLQDGSSEAWHYLYAVLGLLPPYRELLAGHLDLLPFLEQLYRWAPKVKSHLKLDLLDAIDKAFPPDSSLFHHASHVDCSARKKTVHPRSACAVCPIVKAQWDRQHKKELVSWLRPLTLPELQHCLGIVGTAVALEETQWLDSLSLLPLALATNIPVQYESSGAYHAEEEPARRKSQLGSEAPDEQDFKKRNLAFSTETSVLSSEAKSILKAERPLRKIHFLYLNVAPDRYFKPYNLVVVPPNKVDPEHYIFSPFGILHVHPLEGSESMALGTWHRHSVLWQELQSIPFFKYFLLRKALTCWKKNVRLYGLNQIQTLLRNHLLLIVPHFGAGLIHISRLIQELYTVPWLPKEPDQTYELLDLEKALAKENHKALRLFCRFLNLCTSILQLAPRQNPFLLSRLVFDENSQLSSMPRVESIIQTLTKSLQSIKTSALKVIQSADLRTTRDPLDLEEDNEEELSEFLMPKFQEQPSDAVRLFCGPSVGFVWPWKSYAITNVLEVCGHRLRGQYLPPSYDQMKENLDNNAQIRKALAAQQALLEGMQQEVQEFCSEQQWLAVIYDFLEVWGPQKLENLKGSPIKDYVVLLTQLQAWQKDVSNMPVQLLTKGKLLLLSCHDLQTELESKLNSTRTNILEQVQNECRSRNQQLMTELTDFLRFFQTINSDIHSIAQCSQKLNEANEQYPQLEERVDYVRSLHELLRNHCGVICPENETLDISLLDTWEAFQFERSQAAEFLLSKRYALVPKLQQLIAAALAELEGLLKTALSGPFMDPSQDQRSTEYQLLSLEQQYLKIVSDVTELHYAYVTFTGTEDLYLPTIPC